MAIDHCPRYYFIFYFISWNPSDGWLLIKNNGGSSWNFSLDPRDLLNFNCANSSTKKEYLGWTRCRRGQRIYRRNVCGRRPANGCLLRFRHWWSGYIPSNNPNIFLFNFDCDGNRGHSLHPSFFKNRHPCPFRNHWLPDWNFCWNENFTTDFNENRSQNRLHRNAARRAIQLVEGNLLN